MDYIHITIADDHPIVLNGLEKMLGTYPYIKVIDCCPDVQTLLESLQKQKPDVLLLDVQMKGMQGDEAAKIISQQYPDIAILALTNLDHAFHVRNMFMNGAKGYLLKDADPDTLVEAIGTVYNGAQFLDKAFKGGNLKDLMSSSSHAETMPKLTRREKEVLELIAEELSSAQIAKKLFVTLSAVENYRYNLLLKLNVKNVVGLIKKAIQMGLIKS